MLLHFRIKVTSLFIMYKTRSARPGQVLQARQSLVPRAKYVEVIDNNKLKKAVEQQGYQMYKNLLFADTTEVYTVNVVSGTPYSFGTDIILRSDRSGKLLELNQIVYTAPTAYSTYLLYTNNGSTWGTVFSPIQVGVNYIYVTRGEGTSMIFSLRCANSSYSQTPKSFPTLYTTEYDFLQLLIDSGSVTFSFIYRYYQISTSL